jgi:hypothetical protein
VATHETKLDPLLFEGDTKIVLKTIHNDDTPVKYLSLYLQQDQSLEWLEGA